MDEELRLARKSLIWRRVEKTIPLYQWWYR